MFTVVAHNTHHHIKHSVTLEYANTPKKGKTFPIQVFLQSSVELKKKVQDTLKNSCCFS